MYRITFPSGIFVVTEAPNWVLVHPDDPNCFVPCSREQAEGVAYKGNPTLFRDGVTVEEIDGGDEIGALHKQGDSTEKLAGETAATVQTQETLNSIVFVTLAEAGSIDDVTAGEHISVFAPWVPDVSYTVGQMRQYNGKLYRCITAHTSQADWTPDTAVSLWVAVADPAEEYPAWSQPIGAHDAYDTGDKVSHNGKRWMSTVDDNVWEPGVYGWQEVTD